MAANTVRPTPPAKDAGADKDVDVTSIVHPPSELELKRGGLCFGCCDMRRAVFYVSVASIACALVSVPLTVHFVDVWNLRRETGGNDLLEERHGGFAKWADAAVEAHSTERAAIYAGVTIGSSVAGMVGAVAFLAWPVCVPVLWHVASVCLEWTFAFEVANGKDGAEVPVVTFVVITVVRVMFVCPHVCLVREIKSGILTKENYSREEECCCCL